MAEGVKKVMMAKMAQMAKMARTAKMARMAKMAQTARMVHLAHQAHQAHQANFTSMLSRTLSAPSLDPAAVLLVLLRPLQARAAVFLPLRALVPLQWPWIR